MLAFAAVVLVAATAGSVLTAAPSTTDQKRKVDSELAQTRKRLDAARGRESVLTSQVETYSAKLREVESQLTPLETKLKGLEAEVAQLEAKLAILNASLERERRKLQNAEIRLGQTRRALGDRLRQIYNMGEPDPIMAMLQAGSISAAVETTDVMRRITDRDGELVTGARRVAEEVRASRDKIRDDRDEVQRSEERAQAAAQEVRTTTDALQQRRDQLAKVRGERKNLLARVSGDREQIEAEARELERESASLAAKIVAAQNPGIPVDSTVSSAGMIWPTHGTLTSGFGYRWGRMHEGIDIAVPSGTPVVAAASGTVIQAGWGGGYGNLVVIDHGGGIATAYAHNTSLAVSVGQHVTQGSVVAYSGSTGHSTGPHVHFEVRVGGAARDPMGYL